MKEGFRVVKLVGKGGDSLLESGENAAGESDSDGKYLDEDHVVWVRRIWYYSPGFLCKTSSICKRDPFVCRVSFPPYFSENGWSPTWGILCLAGIP